MDWSVVANPRAEMAREQIIQQHPSFQENGSLQRAFCTILVLISAILSDNARINGKKPKSGAPILLEGTKNKGLAAGHRGIFLAALSWLTFFR